MTSSIASACSLTLMGRSPNSIGYAPKSTVRSSLRPSHNRPRSAVSGVRSSAVSTSERDDHDADACPACGTRVESAISGPGEELRESTERRCPGCGKVLRRVVGGAWTIDETTS